MKIITRNIKKGFIKILIENLDDLWYLNTVINEGDVIEGQTLRKIKIGEEEERKQEKKVIKIYVKLKVEKINYEGSLLRVLGKIIEASSNEVSIGSYHSIDIKEGSIITLTKEKWYEYQLKKIEEASIIKAPRILICIFDREEAIFAISERGSYKIISKIKGEVQKKIEGSVVGKNFYLEIIKFIKEFMENYNAEYIIIASPAFWCEELMKEVKEDELKKRITLASVSQVNEAAIKEVLKRQEIKEIFKKDKAARDFMLIEELKKEIAKDGLAAYSLQEVEKALSYGAIKTLLVSDSFIKKSREEGFAEKLEKIMKETSKQQGDIHIVNSENEAGKELDGLTGIAALLRFKIS